MRKSSENLFVAVSNNETIGWGESVLGECSTLESADQMKDVLSGFIKDTFPWSTIDNLNSICRNYRLPAFLHAGLDIALWDLHARQSWLPLNQLLGIPYTNKPTSLTIGMHSKDILKELVPQLLNDFRVDALKIKLGSPHGIEADKEMFAIIVESIKGCPMKLRVDANGGWNISESKIMMQWLFKYGVEFVEQPLKPEDDGYLKELYNKRPLPIFLDESIDFAHQVPALANYIDGINIKLMKCGGITEALNIISASKNYRLKTMIGCMSESSIAIAAAAAISGAIDYIDLDSCYNLDPDPASGVKLINGITSNRQVAGHGANLKRKYLVTA